jgi:hypothetical protein
MKRLNLLVHNKKNSVNTKNFICRYHQKYLKINPLINLHPKDHNQIRRKQVKNQQHKVDYCNLEKAKTVKSQGNQVKEDLTLNKTTFHKNYNCLKHLKKPNKR